MNKFRWLILLMCITILGVAGFQVYWLRQNYKREEKTLAIKAEVAFRETVQKLRVAKLKLGSFPADSLQKRNVKIIVNENRDKENLKVHFEPGEEIITTINAVSDKLKDSLKKTPELKREMIISMNKTSGLHHNDSGDNRIHRPGRDDFFWLLYGVDSLQDSLKLHEIDTAYAKTMKQQKLGVPFTILQLDSTEKEGPDDVTVGFVNPVTYRLKLGNTFPYLIRRISLPVLFSIILLGITILSFVLLYRNLLRQRRLAELKNEFISNITHELKTPIATVGVAIEALKNFNAISDPQRTKEYLDISSHELQRLNLLVDKVLKLSMFENKQLDLKMESVNLKELAEEVTRSMKLQIEKYHAAVLLTADGDLNLQGDKLHLTSVIFNLLDNALKYSKDEPDIRIELKGNDNEVILKVIDNGIGIPPQYKDKIFEKFFRIPHGDTHNAKGYGLGLSYVAQVIQKHRGMIEMESKPGQGTTFVITLPKTSVS